MAAVQADIWIAKCFRGKVYALRKLDFKVLCKVLEEAATDVIPEKAAETPSTTAQSSSSSSSASTESKPGSKDSPEKAEEVTVGGTRRPAKEKADKADKATNAGSQVICSFSPELQRQLASGVAGSDGSGFDQALNALKLDDTTRENIRQELMIRPAVNPLQAEQLIAKSFRGKVNTLRSLGLRKLRTALEAALPDGAGDGH